MDRKTLSRSDQFRQLLLGVASILASVLFLISARSEASVCPKLASTEIPFPQGALKSDQETLDLRDVSNEVENAAQLLGQTLSKSEILWLVGRLFSDTSSEPLLVRIARVFDIKVARPSYKEIDRIKSEGPTIILANSSVPGRARLALAASLSYRRSDLRLTSREENSAPDPWIVQGGARIIFPAANHEGKFPDAPWSTELGRWVLAHPNASINAVVAKSASSNGSTAPLQTFTYERQDGRVYLNISSSVTVSSLKTDGSSSEAFTRFLYAYTHILSGRFEWSPDYRKLNPIAGPVPQSLLAAERSKMTLLLDNKGIQVWLAKGSEIPNTLNEIGRIREEVFRSVSEGSGKDRDVDEYDPYYHHLIAVDPSSWQILGAKRMGLVDEIMKQRGLNGFYNRNFFHYDGLLTTELKNGIELGRAFVDFRVGRLAVRTFDSLWKALGAFIVENPKYTHLFGPVTISNSYSDFSKLLLIRYFTESYASPLRSQVRARKPVRLDNIPLAPEVSTVLSRGFNIAQINRIVTDIEGTGIPPMMISCAKMEARYLAVNHDPEFDDFNSVDGMMLIDLLKGAANPEVASEMKKYFGEEGYRSFCKTHGITSR